MRVYDDLSLLAIPDDVAVKFDGFAARCAVHARDKLLVSTGTLFRTHFYEMGAEVLNDVTPLRPDIGPLACWDCNRILRGLNDLNPV